MVERPTHIALRPNRRLNEQEYTAMSKMEPGFLRKMLENQQCVDISLMTTAHRRKVVRTIEQWLERNASDFYALNGFTEGATELFNIQCHDPNDALQLRLHMHGLAIDG